MTQGRLIAVVGPSGVGKDSVMAGLHDLMPSMHLVRRVITRAPGLGGEDYDAATPAAFETLVQNGAFAVHWGAHGLRYGIPLNVRDRLHTGTNCLVNFSRKALSDAVKIFPNFVVLNITASEETLAKRLAARGRENQEDIAKRISVADKPLPAGLKVIYVSNDGPLPTTIAHAAKLLQPVRA
ncbi:phosphonate metabolism protein/1,5-bisphosphokinase (PRPP-forming) PhnN [Loktanella sp. F6476L]|uniref:phosphonate metabolism protein/1,5-bisphosphokinase (PRPP-forming) PhnN n=1 Tax=Loktanella sp. F6476L TaxID=2926405 RepID=UPI001FF37C68|nr:phosphonate metabolism protein/1,5-bisphosphokinase (PRPP-forming) PhnN [Loktanella sp. F6476L]MCK0119739.1 phosphonate metabolism protein/1,5-bisphosphokinase (PRPP-forming) PhnN [Loktanella sp. F6476L]